MNALHFPPLCQSPGNSLHQRIRSVSAGKVQKDSKEAIVDDALEVWEHGTHKMFIRIRIIC